MIYIDQSLERNCIDTGRIMFFLLSVERYFGICYPIHSRVRRKRRVFVYLAPVIVGRYIWNNKHLTRFEPLFLSLIYTSPKLMEVSTNGRVNVEISDDPLYNKVKNIPAPTSTFLSSFHLRSTNNIWSSFSQLSCPCWASSSSTWRCTSPSGRTPEGMRTYTIGRVVRVV